MPVFDGTVNDIQKKIIAGDNIQIDDSGEFPIISTSGVMVNDDLPAVLPVNKGGTGKTSWTSNALLYAPSSTTLSQLSKASENNSVLSQNSSGAPFWDSKYKLLASNANLDSIIDFGTYYSPNTTGGILNKPSELNNSTTFRVEVLPLGATQKSQRLTTCEDNPRIFERVYYYNTWKPWNSFYSKDVIIAQGIATSPDNVTWNYRKWNSGVYECWCTQAASTVVASATLGAFSGGQTLRGCYGIVKFPITFNAIPNITYSADITNSYDTCGKANVTTSQFTWYVTTTSGATLPNAATISAQVVGRWK